MDSICFHLTEYLKETTGVSRQQLEAIWDEIEPAEEKNSNFMSRRTSEIPLRVIFCENDKSESVHSQRGEYEVYIMNGWLLFEFDCIKAI